MVRKVNFIKPGKVINFLGKPYRILLVNPEIVILIEVGIKKYHFETVDFDYMVVADSKKLYEIEDIYSAKQVDVSDEELEIITEKAKDIEKILNSIYPYYSDLMAKKSVTGVDEYKEKYNIKSKTAHKHIRNYLQTGRDLYSLVDMRSVNSGKKSQEIKDPIRAKHFEQAFRKFKSGHVTSITAAYNDMLLNHYSTHEIDEHGEIKIKLFSKEEIPSEKQFRRYVNKQLGNLTVASFKKSARERRNNDRPRYGNAQTGCAYPGDIVEIDACELDMIIVSENNRRRGIGRPVVYFSLDVFSLCIIGYYVGFENNSFLGASSLLSNMFFGDNPHYRMEEGLSRINITPGGIIPSSIRVDQGAEWISNDIRRLGKECGIDVTIVSPAMGSLKGLVENSFHVYQEEIGNFGSKFGAIYQAYESKHYDTASLILMNVKETIDAFILMFNQKYRKKYKLTKDMSGRGVKPIPCELWDYGIKHLGNPLYTTENKVHKLVYALCKPCVKDMRCSLSMEGITIKGLKYICRDQRFIALMEKNHYSRKDVEYEARYDPRLVDYIWVKIEDDILQVPLAPKKENQMSYKGMTWFMYNLYYLDDLEGKAAYEQKDRENRLTFIAKTKQIMEESKEKQNLLPGKNENKNIRMFRKIEQEEERRRSALAGQIAALEDEYLLDKISEGCMSEIMKNKEEEITEENAQPKKKLRYIDLIPDEEDW